MTDYPDLCNNEPSCQKPELLNCIRKLEIMARDLAYAEQEAVKKYDALVMRVQAVLEQHHFGETVPKALIRNALLEDDDGISK